MQHERKGAQAKIQDLRATSGVSSSLAGHKHAACRLVDPCEDNETIKQSWRTAKSHKAEHCLPAGLHREFGIAPCMEDGYAQPTDGSSSEEDSTARLMC